MFNKINNSHWMIINFIIRTLDQVLFHIIALTDNSIDESKR